MGYYEMIKEAITALKDRKGSSGQAIKKVATARRLFPDPAVAT